MRSGALLRQPAYRRLWTARTTSQAGDVVQFTAMALLVLQLTGTASGVSLLALVEAAPVLLLAPVAGPLVDRLPRIRVMVGADGVRAVLAVVLALWHGNVALAYAVAFVMAAAGALFNPAVNSVLPDVVSQDELRAANSGIWSAAVAIQLVAAPLAGVTVSEWGFGAAFAVNAASFVVSGALLQRLRLAGSASGGQNTGFARAGLQTWRLMYADATLRPLVVVQALAALSAGATSAMLVVLARRELHVGADGYGVMLAAIGAGALAGPALLRRLRAPERDVVVGAFALRGGTDALLAAVPVLPAALPALVGYGMGTSTGSIAFTSLVQRVAPGPHRGRVFATFDVVWQAMRLASIAAGGVVADHLGVRTVFGAGAVLMMLAAAAGARAAGQPPKASAKARSRSGVAGPE